MKGIMGLQDVILNTQRLNQRRQDGIGSSDGISFNQFMQRWKGQSTATAQKSVMGKEEQNLLEKSLVHLLNFKMLLSTDRDKTLSTEQLKKLLQKMGGDLDFINSLTPELKAMLQKMLKQLQEHGDVKKLDQKALDQLKQIWEMSNEKKRQKQLEEVEALIAAIEARLAVAGIEAKAQIVSKDGEKSVKVSFYEMKNGQMKAGSGEEGQVVSKSLLSKIANFLGETDGTAAKEQLSKLTVDFREELRNYLKRESQPVSWRREELSHRAQYGALQELGELSTEAQLNEMSATTVEQVLSEEATGETKLNLLAQVEETQVQMEMQEHDVFAELLSNVEAGSKEDKSLTQAMTRQPRGAEQSNPMELFEQMVEKFRMELKPGITQMNIKLYPEELGQLQLKVVIEKGIVTAQFLAESVRVKEVIEQNLSHLKDTFAREGIHWDQITVDVGQDGLQENPFTYQGGQQLKDQRHSGKRQSFKDSMEEELELAEVDLEEARVKDPNRLVDYRV